MRKFVVSLLILNLVSFTVFSQQKVWENSLMWEVSGNGLEKLTYIFGTIHILSKKDYEDFKVLNEKVEKADLLLMELDLNVSLKEQIGWAQALMLPAGKTVQNYVNPDLYHHFKLLMLDTLKISHKKYEKYIRFKPFAIYSLVLKEQIGKIESYEQNLNNLAKNKNVKTAGLETFEYQLAIFDSISYDEQIRMFFTEAELESELDSMTVMYFEQDINAMAKLLVQDDNYAGYEYDLVIKRNNEWIPKIESFMKSNSIVVAVGAAHLGGNHGLLNLLEKQGYTIRAVKL